VYTFAIDELEVKKGDRVIVETERGMALGTVAETHEDAPGTSPVPLKKVLRVAEERDIQRAEANDATEKEGARVCIDLIHEKHLPMKLLDVEYLFDRSKIVFCFASENRVDFRELVRDLARHFHTRIEMRQVGVRDEAKMVGGVGACGRELCCAIWLTDFAPISVRMAKSQNISLNPAKISGICGRLMCCLAYENKMYEDLSKGMPKVGKKVMTQKGEGRVIRRNALEGNFVIFNEHGEVEVGIEEYNVFKAERKDEPQAAETPETEPAQEASVPEISAPEATPARAPEPVPAQGEPEDQAEGEAEEGGETASPAAPGEGERRPSRRRRRRRKKPSQAKGSSEDG
jgi:cell fate regulator YaaT (PSP1 superfamily)